MKKMNEIEGTRFSATQTRLKISLVWLMVLLAPLQLFAEISASQTEETGTTSLLQDETRTVTGKVTDEAGEPVPGATVVVKGTTSGTVSDMDGSFTLSNVPEDATLVVTFVGMKKEEVDVTGEDQLNIVLQEETMGLDEVVVVGYGAQKKETVTGSLSSVSSD
ncbi:MAG: carboxypeptidase-like regulatory domain-containing protein, partial [Marinilabilia sp.]